jgi:hypothetical protein
MEKSSDIPDFKRVNYLCDFLRDHVLHGVVGSGLLQVL